MCEKEDICEVTRYLGKEVIFKNGLNRVFGLVTAN